MRYFLNVCYLGLLLLVSPWLAYAAWRRGKYRRGLLQKLCGQVPRRRGQRPCVWLHAVSAGEVNLLKSLTDQLGSELPQCECVISTTTRTGFELATRRHPEHTVFYCPLDFSWSVEWAMQRIRPDLLVLMELELWPNLVAAARRHGARVAVVNARLSDRSFRGYRRAAWLVKRMLRQIDLIVTQNELYASRFRTLGARPASVQIAGSLKLDGVQTDRQNDATQRLAELAGVSPRDVVFLAGSTQAPEESLALQAFLSLAQQYPALRLILVPRHPERCDEVANLLQRSGQPWQRRTQLASETRAHRRILLVDSMGELAAWWGVAQIAYVGGSMGSREGQNMIEPAAYGAAVSFGPRTANFQDAVESLLSRDAALVVRDGRELEAFVRHCLEDPQGAAERGHRAQQWVTAQQGAAHQTVRYLGQLVAPHQSSEFQTSSTSSARPSRIESSSTIRA